MKYGLVILWGISNALGPGRVSVSTGQMVVMVMVAIAGQLLGLLYVISEIKSHNQTEW